MADKKHVLIVDDSLMSRMMIRAIIEEHHPDWDITEASNGQEAVNCEIPQIDLITLDMTMPVMDGLEAAPLLRTRYPEARIALLTANVQQHIQQKASELSLEFIAKPLTEEKVVDFIDR